MNAYNIFDEEHSGTILYHAIASDEEQVRELAEDAGIDISGLTIEFERANVRDGLGYPYSARIEDALIH